MKTEVWRRIAAQSETGFMAGNDEGGRKWRLPMDAIWISELVVAMGEIF